MKKILFIFFVVLSFVGMFFYESIDILMRFFPLENLEAVVFTLTHNVGGSKNIIWILLEPCLKSSVENTLLVFSLIVISSFGFVLFRGKKKYMNLKTLFTKAFYPIVFCLGLLCLFVWSPVVYKFPLLSYLKFYGALFDDEPVYNSLYEENYVYPDSAHIVFEKKKNLIFVMLESMESNFQDKKSGGNLDNNLIPEITELLKTNISFVPGGVTIEGTGWTMGETVAKTCGIPLQEPIEHNAFGLRNYLENVVCLTDILRKNGYEIRLLKGASAKFGSMDYFSISHGLEKENIYDLLTFTKKGIPRSDTSCFESIKDADLYSEVKKTIQDMNKMDSPWMIWFYTVDTHFPFGCLDPACIEMPSTIGIKDQFPFVVQCASKLLNEFVEWTKTQDWFENTTIVIMGDHPAMIAPEVIGFPNERMEHYWLDVFINSEIDSVPKMERQFTSFDMFPTILESMGVKIEGRALGLGRSLFSIEPTLIEIYGEDSLNAMIKKKGTMYKSFWD